MKRIRLSLILAMVPALFILAITAGCGGKDTGKPPAPANPGGGTGEEAKTKPAPAGAKEELASTGWGTLTGKVTFDGTPPAADKIKIPAENKDKAYCEGNGGDTTEPTALRVGPNKGVKNIVVWLRAPAGKFFKIPPSKKEVKETVEIGQPRCAFEPHVVVLYPSYFDGKKQKETGQKFKIINNATIPHNTNFKFSSELLNTGGNPLIGAGKFEEVPVKVSKDKDVGKEQQIFLNCSIHPWMRGFGWVFDHPFSAVSKADGTFEIKDAPADVDLDLVYWQETLNGGKPKVEGKVKLKDGPNTKDISIKN